MAYARAEEYERRRDQLEGWDVHVTVYRIGERWFCKVDNVSPGAIVARAEGTERAEAVAAAVARARTRLAATRRFVTSK